MTQPTDDLWSDVKSTPTGIETRKMMMMMTNNFDVSNSFTSCITTNYHHIVLDTSYQLN